MHAAFEGQGIGADRVTLLPMEGALRDHLARYHDMDIALDPFPFNGGVTTQSALWMGLPVVSLAAPSLVGRLSRCMLARLDLDHLVAEDADSYCRIAAALASDLDGLSRLRQGMRGRFQASAIFDHAGHTRELEAAYRKMWHRWCAGETRENL